MALNQLDRQMPHSPSWAMQDRYVGDVGDFVKLGILRALSAERRLGVAWWLHPDEQHNGDGRHISYLQRGDWRDLDPDLFDGLAAIVASGQRSVAALEGSGLLRGAAYATTRVPTDGPPISRRQARAAWLDDVRRDLASADLILIDPDNGLEPARFSPAARRAAKCVSLAELRDLARPGRALLVYHHQTRRPGGHEAELRHWGERLAATGFRQVDAIRARPYSPRAFFLLDADKPLRERAAALCATWADLLSWRPDLHAAAPQGRAAA